MRVRHLAVTPLIVSTMIVVTVLAPSSGEAQIKSFHPPEYTASGDLILPKNFHEWVYVGSPLTPNALNGGMAGFPEFHKAAGLGETAYRRDLRFPDGAVLVKEVFQAAAQMTTGTVTDFTRIQRAILRQAAEIRRILTMTMDENIDSMASLNRRHFLMGSAASGLILGYAAPPALSAALAADTPPSGHLYMQTNETRNAIIHYHRFANGTIVEVERVATGGAGSGLLSPIYHVPRPNHFEGAGSVILTPDHRFLFTTNGGDNSVSSFAVGRKGRLTLLDVKPTGNTQLGGAKSLAYAPSSSTLFVVHSFGPDHLRLMSVDGQGKLTARPERYSVGTTDWPNRTPTTTVLSPDEKFLILGTTFDELPTKNPDGTVILWIPHGPDGKLHVIASNAPDPDGIVVFPVGGDGALGERSFYDAGAPSPFYITFLHNRPDTLIIGYAVGNGVSMGRIDADGKIRVGPLVPIDTSAGLPSELCWLAISPDDRWVFTTNFGYSYISSYRINGNELAIARDPASPKVPGDGTYRAIDGVVSSGPSDSWLSPEGAYLYQIFGNASKLVGYAIQPDGSLKEITNVTIPYNSPQGLAGF